MSAIAAVFSINVIMSIMKLAFHDNGQKNFDARQEMIFYFFLTKNSAQSILFMLILKMQAA